MNILDRLKSCDWEEAFAYAKEPTAVAGWVGSTDGFGRKDVVEIVAIDDGSRDEGNWIGLFLLSDGRYAFLSAGCDYTGWDCQAWGSAVVGGDRATMIRYGMDEGDRDRLSLVIEIPGGAP